jgi:hypothetical protein
MTAIDTAHLASSAGWINTRTGKKFYPLAPRIEDFDIEDQAGTLAHVARYGGQPRRFYPVALHAWIMSHVVAWRAEAAGKSEAECLELARWALVHDNGEAYYGDITRPLKQLAAFEFIRELEERYEALIADWLGLKSREMPAEVRELDLEMCAYEAPIVYDRLHPDWKFPEKRGTPGDHWFIESSIDRYSDLPQIIKRIYEERFDYLFPSHGLKG